MSDRDKCTCDKERPCPACLEYASGGREDPPLPNDAELERRAKRWKCPECGGTEFRLEPPDPMEQTGGTPEEYQVWARMGGGKKICITCKHWSESDGKLIAIGTPHPGDFKGPFISTEQPKWYPPPRPVDLAATILRREHYIDNVTFTITDMNVWQEMKDTVERAVEVGLRETGKPVGVVVIYER